MLTSVKLSDFKSFHRARARLGRFSLIVGTNASGKSNLREALRVLHGIGLGYSLADILGEKYGPGGILQWRGIRGGTREASFEGCGHFSITASIALKKSPSGLEQHFRYDVHIDLNNPSLSPRIVRESLAPQVYHSHPPDDPLDQQDEHLIQVSYPHAGNHKKPEHIRAYSSARPVLSQLPEHRDQSKNRRLACETVCDIFASMRFLDLDPEAMRQPSQPGQRILGDRGEHLSSVLQNICQDEGRKATLLEWLRALTPMDATDFIFHADLTGRILVSLKESNGFEISAYSASDGTLRFLALIAALLSEDSGRIYFFEEFDNGIHPTRLHLLLDLVQRACERMNIQVIGTTHNPALLAFLDDQARSDALLVYRSEDHPGSRLVPILDLPQASEILSTQDLGRLHQAGWLEDAAIFSEHDEREDEYGR